MGGGRQSRGKVKTDVKEALHFGAFQSQNSWPHRFLTKRNEFEEKEEKRGKSQGGLPKSWMNK